MSHSVVFRLCPLAAFLLAWPSLVSAADQPQWGQTHTRNMVSEEKGLPETFDAGKRNGQGGIDLKPDSGVRWVGAPRRAELRLARGGRRPGLRGHEQRGPARRPPARRPRRADVFRREDRRLPLATLPAEVHEGEVVRLALRRHHLHARGRGRPALPGEQPRRGDVPRRPRHGQRQRRPVQGGRPPDGRRRQAAARARPEGRRHPLALRHARHAGRRAAQRLELLGAGRRRPALRLHEQRRRLDAHEDDQPRRADHDRARQEDRQAIGPRRFRHRPRHLPRPVEFARDGHRRRQEARLSRRGQRLPVRLRGVRPEADRRQATRRSSPTKSPLRSRTSGGSTAIRWRRRRTTSPSSTSTTATRSRSRPTRCSTRTASTWP